jgi:SpoVK/Ycf46/Vps4 family AAA+-type ATPase
MRHFTDEAAAMVPSTHRDALVTAVAPVRWDDVGGLDDIKSQIRQVQRPELPIESFALISRFQ